MPRPAGSPGVQSGPDPTKCVSPQCFDALVRSCVDCKLFRPPELNSASPPSDPSLFPARASPPCVPCPPSPSPPLAVWPSSLAPRTPLQQQESVGTGATAQAEPVLPMPALLLGAPALLGLALALVLVLVALVTLRRRRQRTRGPTSPEAPEREQDVGLQPLASQRQGCAAGEASGTGTEMAVTQF
ncbi:tumor necrosis factor receptor superfamily member 13C isoform X3 [Phyllostomus hastatus]|uniref:tumor necrosis factor receptor superfamily member 13C isoform X3 n=1 Tax=Phyllostomus hastatus TaxID=9423 RepID=UPI001E682C9C|nr:tumor necrosis factor receptor superfamily member 13C isoform X3 [Phyllostomus hastatus]